MDTIIAVTPPQFKVPRLDACAAGVVRLDQRDHCQPWHHPLHLAQELLAPGCALLARVLQARKADLRHASIISAQSGSAIVLDPDKSAFLKATHR